VLSDPSNFFDNILDVTPPPWDDCDELDHYLAMDTEDVKDGLMWWYEKRVAFPRLSCMAWDYLSIPGMCTTIPESTLTLIFCPLATTVDVERVFSHGRLVLPHVRNRLGVESTCTLLCVGLWSSLGLVKDGHMKMSLCGDDVDEEDDLPEDWDAISMAS
jgi:hypothetical protein